MSTGDILSETSKTPHRRVVWRKLVGIVLLLLGLTALAWGRGWFRGPTEIPGGDLIEGDPEVIAVVQDARAAVAREPQAGATWGRLGQVLQIHDFLAPALPAYAEATRLDSGNAVWPYLRASILAEGPRPADAISDLQQAIDRGGLDEFPRLRLGELLIRLGRFDEAAEPLRHVLETRPNDPHAHLQMAQVAVSRQDWAVATRHLDAVGDAPSARKQVCALKLLIHTRRGEMPAAKREQARLASLPDDTRWPDRVFDELSNFVVGAKHRVARALSLLRDGQIPAAISSLEEVVRDYPDSGVAYACLGRSLILSKNLTAAENALKRSLELAPESADVWSILATVHVHQGNPKAALECLRQVNRLKPADAEAHCKVGQLLSESGDRAGATEAYRQALRYQPDSPHAREGLDKLTSNKP